MMETGKLEEVLAGWMNRHPTPGLAAAIVVDGEIVLMRGYGRTSVDEGAALVTKTTLFRILSTTKMLVWHRCDATGRARHPHAGYPHFAVSPLVTSEPRWAGRPDYPPPFAEPYLRALHLPRRLYQSGSGRLGRLGSRVPAEVSGADASRTGLALQQCWSVSRGLCGANGHGDTVSALDAGAALYAAGHGTHHVRSLSRSDLSLVPKDTGAVRMVGGRWITSLCRTLPGTRPEARSSCSEDLAQVALMYLHDGTVGTERLLSAETIALMQAPQVKYWTRDEEGYGLTWATFEYKSQALVRHNGGGVSSFQSVFILAPTQNAGLVVLAQWRARGRTRSESS